MYRFSFDMGTNSLGWAVYEIKDRKPEFLENSGVRIYHDGREDKSKTSLAQSRTDARQARRQHDRKLKKRYDTINFINHNFLIPNNLLEVNEIINQCPYMLRDKAVTNELTKYELGRVLFALSQRRGFLSNRKQKAENKLGQTNEDKDKLEQEIGNGTLGQALYNRLQNGLPVLNNSDRDGLYTTRQMYKTEFNKIKEKQYSLLSNDKWNEIEDILFYQRPLKEQPKGRCSVYVEEDLNRTFTCIPSAIRFSILQDLNNLKVIIKDEDDKFIEKRFLNDTEREILYKHLLKSKYISFNKISIKLSLKSNTEYNLSTAKSGKLTGSAIDVEMSKILGNDFWNSLKIEDKDKISIKLIDTAEEKDLYVYLSTYNIHSNKISEILSIDWDKKLTPKVGRFSALAYQGLCRHLSMKKNIETNEYKSTTESIKELQTGRDNSELSEKLEYYAQMCTELGVNRGINRGNDLENEFGFIANPTVHIGLNQLKKVVNKLIDKYGQPESIILEVARELKMNQDDKSRLNKLNKEKEANRQKIKNELKTKFNKTDLSRDDYVRYQLWEELAENVADRNCPYTGKTISIEDLFRENSQIEIEHILPISKTLDDTFNNKTLSYRVANAFKGNKSPAEAFYEDKKFNKSYQDILDRVNNSNMSNRKKAKFDLDAIKNWEDEDNGFLARQLKDTQYLSKVSKHYLECICKDVNVIPGKLTSVLRHQWGLNGLYGKGNDKERSDHRHHAVDAIAIGLCDRSMLQKAANASKANRNGEEKLLFPCPIDNKVLQGNAKYILDNMLISHKVNHKKQGQLHEATAYGYIAEEQREEGFKKYNLFIKKPIKSLSVGEVARIRSKKIRDSLQMYLENGGTLQSFTENGKVNSVQVLVSKNDDGIEIIKHKSKLNKIEHEKRVLSGGNLCINIWKMPDGKLQVQNVTYFKANKKDIDLRPDPNAKKVMTLYKGDSIAWEEDGKTYYGVVKKWQTNGLVTSLINEASGKDKSGKLTPYNPIFLSFGSKNLNIFKAKKVRKVHIDEIGHLQDSFDWSKY